jgi:hypothetical protein
MCGSWIPGFVGGPRHLVGEREVGVYHVAGAQGGSYIATNPLRLVRSRGGDQTHLAARSRGGDQTHLAARGQPSGCPRPQRDGPPRAR